MLPFEFYIAVIIVPQYIWLLCDFGRPEREMSGKQAPMLKQNCDEWVFKSEKVVNIFLNIHFSSLFGTFNNGIIPPHVEIPCLNGS